MIGGFKNGDFNLKSPIAKKKLRQIKALYSIMLYPILVCFEVQIQSFLLHQEYS